MKTRSLPLSALLVALLSSWSFSAPAEEAAKPEAPAPAIADSSAADSVSEAADTSAADAVSVPPADSVLAARDSVSADSAGADSVLPADDFAGKVLLFPPQIGEDVGERDGLAFVLVYEAEKRYGSELREHPAECAALGCADPFDILPAVWLTSAAAVVVGVLAAKLFARVWRA